MSSDEGIVFVVDDDDELRESLAFLLRSADLNVETFPSAAAFLERPEPTGPACLILDVRMPELSGLDLQRRLNAACSVLPVIFLTGHADVPMSVRALKNGASDFLQKPVEDETLLAAVDAALRRHAVLLRQRTEREEVAALYRVLTPREREVFALIVDGFPNQWIANTLEISVKTVKIHRGRVMAKMQADSLAHLVSANERFGLTRESNG